MDLLRAKEIRGGEREPSELNRRWRRRRRTAGRAMMDELVKVMEQSFVKRAARLSPLPSSESMRL